MQGNALDHADVLQLGYHFGHRIGPPRLLPEQYDGALRIGGRRYRVFEHGVSMCVADATKRLRTGSEGLEMRRNMCDASVRADVRVAKPVKLRNLVHLAEPRHVLPRPAAVE